MPFYAVQNGDQRQLFTSWTDAKPFCINQTGVRYKKFHDKSEAEAWLGGPVTKKVKIQAEQELHVYTDGACSKNGAKGARAGIGVYFGEDDPRNVSEPLPAGERQTNNRAELLAIERAVDIVSLEAGVNTLNIYTDSQYSHKALTQWIWGWLQKDWVTSKGTPVENRDILERLHNKLQGVPFTVEWHYVKAHNGDPGNEAADRLATACLR